MSAPCRTDSTQPWIFTEIKERRDWDISSRERLDGIGKLASYMVEHFGADTQGIETSRRFLCEALSWQQRYVPVGLLERLPAQLNHRPMPFRGRDELETLLASDNSADWVKICASLIDASKLTRTAEMFLGPAADTFHFTPKHKCVSMSLTCDVAPRPCPLTSGTSADTPDRSNAYETQG